MLKAPGAIPEGVRPTKMRSISILLPAIAIGCATDEPLEIKTEVAGDISETALEKTSVVFENEHA